MNKVEKVEHGDLQVLNGRAPVASGNVAVTMFKEKGLWRVKIGVFGNPDIHNMRAGCNGILEPEKFATAKALTEGVGRMAAFLAKRVEKRTEGKFDACIDETDAYHGAVELFNQCMLELKADGVV